MCGCICGLHQNIRFLQNVLKFVPYMDGAAYLPTWSVHCWIWIQNISKSNPAVYKRVMHPNQEMHAFTASGSQSNLPFQQNKDYKS